MKRRCVAIAVVGLLGAGTPIAAAPLVSYTVTGSASDWLLNFSVTNTLGIPEQQIYFFGVQLPARDIAGSPTEWDPDIWPTWSNGSYGGSSLVYNNNWTYSGNVANFTIPEISMDETLNGFIAHVSTADAPASVNWFAYSYGTAMYLGSDDFFTPFNPGFEGTAVSATPAVVPEPATLTLLVLGFMTGSGMRHRQ